MYPISEFFGQLILNNMLGMEIRVLLFFLVPLIAFILYLADKIESIAWFWIFIFPFELTMVVNILGFDLIIWLLMAIAPILGFIMSSRNVSVRHYIVSLPDVLIKGGDKK
jgi:hypothetical protein